ncbi:MAG: hypothetical protein Q9M26_02545, partial [Mariprofundales bacterium]|nr:hypothetical protein [Mariprofundales bacterium]
MKKAFISAAAFAVVAVSSIAVAPTTSEAIPAFARQTGAACLSCHFQSFPSLAPMGRAFKMGAFTDVGDQALIEDDNLSTPVVLNATFVTSANITWNKVSGDTTALGAGGTNGTTKTFNIPTDTNLLMAGRVGSHTGAFVEFGGGTGDTNTGANNFQVMNSFDFGSFKGGLNYSDTSFGFTAPLEVSSVFGQHAGLLNGGFVSAVQNVIVNSTLDGQGGFANAGNPTMSTSVAAWVGNDMGYVQVGGSALTAGPGVINNSLVPYVRAVFTPDLGDMDAMIGFAVIKGTQI